MRKKEEIMELLLDMGYQEGFGAEDCSSRAMQRAIGEWFRLYYDRSEKTGADPCLQVAYTIVRKLSRAVFAEYAPGADDAQTAAVLRALPREAFDLACIGGESYFKPVPGDVPQWRSVSRGNLLVFGRDADGNPTDVGLTEKSRRGRQYYTLLERRTADEKGMLTVVNRLFRSGSRGVLGREVSLKEHPAYAALPGRYVYPQAIGSVGLVRLKMPMVNCVDGGKEGVSVYAAACPLIAAIDENEAQLRGEFRRGQSRLVVSRDMLRGGKLTDDVFVGLDDSPETVGITVFSPELREQSYLNRQQAYLRAAENIIGLKRGLLSQVEAVDRTATEITCSEGEYMTAILELRRAWEQAAQEAVRLWGALTGRQMGQARFAWGDGVV